MKTKYHGSEHLSTYISILLIIGHTEGSKRSDMVAVYMSAS